MKFTEFELKEYSKPLSETEEKHCENAIRMVMNALKEIGFNEKENLTRRFINTPTFEARMNNYSKGYEIKIFLQGSYANNTNVRGHSDVDIAVVQEEIFRTKYRVGQSGLDYGFTKASTKKEEFKDVVERALKEKFGKDVERKNKSIKIHGNTYRKDADSVPSLRYRDYTRDYIKKSENFIGGIIIKADDGTEIINYPEQHIKNGIEKNKSTNLYFKKMVRIAKELRYQMEEYGYYYAKKASSFGVECLLYNVPNEVFMKYESYGFIFDEIVKYLFENKENLINFWEVNNIKRLCTDSTERLTIYKGFIDELRRFYEYEI